jgi:hypothetical protein
MGTADNQNQTLKKEIKEGSTLFDLFSSIAEQFPDFCEKVFDPKTGQLSDQVMVIMNGRLIQAKELNSTTMKDKDSVILSPVLVGG